MQFNQNRKLPFDPRLKACAREIKNILDKYSVGGAITLASDTHAEVLVHFPKWSLVGITPDNKLHVRLRHKEPERTSASMHVLLSLSEGTAAHAKELMGVCAYVMSEAKRMSAEIEHIPIEEQEIVPDDWHSGAQPEGEN
jgi:hypothetical protein